MGSSEVVNSRFFHWHNEKKLFQISHFKKKSNNKIETVSIKTEKPINKIFKLPILIYKVRGYLQDAQNKTLIIEGASWIFYSFVIIISFKIIYNDCKIIYISHSIESEIRKNIQTNLSIINLVIRILSIQNNKIINISII